VFTPHYKNRKGHGVHSPFVYRLITKVIEERSPYYRFDDIESLRKRLLQRNDLIALPRKGTTSEYPISVIAAREAIRSKQGKLLFRLANYFQPQSILQAGPTMGLSTLYLTSYRPDVKCVSLESIPAYASISQWVYEQAARTSIDVRVGEYAETLPPVLKDMQTIDLAYFNIRSALSAARLFAACLTHIQPGSVFIFKGIKANKAMGRFWKAVCAHPQVTVTLDLHSVGIVLFNRKWHKRDYTVYF